MKSIFSIPFFAVFLILLSCNEATSQADKTQQPKQESVNILSEDTLSKTIIATYQEATVYAARTDYAFENEIGELILIEGNVYDDTAIDIPDNMLDDDEEIEGPPGANPDLVGKRFLLHYNTEGILFKIELEKK